MQSQASAQEDFSKIQDELKAARDTEESPFCASAINVGSLFDVFARVLWTLKLVISYHYLALGSFLTGRAGQTQGGNSGR